MNELRLTVRISMFPLHSHNYGILLLSKTELQQIWDNLSSETSGKSHTSTGKNAAGRFLFLIGKRNLPAAFLPVEV